MLELKTELRAATSALRDYISTLPTTARFYILPHHRADGDAYGSAFALAALLRKLSYYARVIVAEPIPELYNYLHFSEYEICATADEVAAFIAGAGNLLADSYFCLTDNSEPETRLGARKELFFAVPEERRLIIDHHISAYQACNRFDIAPEKIACCEQVAELIMAFEELTGRTLLDKEMAEFLMTGIITDSGQLNYANVSAQTYLLMSWLKAAGARHELINTSHFHRSTLAKMRLQAYAVNNLQFAYGDRLVLAALPIEYVQEVGANEQDIDGISSWLRELQGVELAVLLRSTALGNVLGSLRSSDKVDAQSLAGLLGGGGHLRAAGFTLYGIDLQEAADKVLAAAAPQFAAGEM